MTISLTDKQLKMLEESRRMLGMQLRGSTIQEIAYKFGKSKRTVGRRLAVAWKRTSYKVT